MPGRHNAVNAVIALGLALRLAEVPAGRPGHAREIASAIAWLAEPDARYCTGHSLVVDGGMLLMGAIANQLANED